jgi:hypothetical protein
MRVLLVNLHNARNGKTFKRTAKSKAVGKPLGRISIAAVSEGAACGCGGV